MITEELIYGEDGVALRRPSFSISHSLYALPYKKTTFYRANLAHIEVTNLKNPSEFAPSSPNFLAN
jgi:hypothetical protein